MAKLMDLNNVYLYYLNDKGTLNCIPMLPGVKGRITYNGKSVTVMEYNVTIPEKHFFVGMLGGGFAADDDGKGFYNTGFYQFTLYNTNPFTPLETWVMFNKYPTFKYPIPEHEFRTENIPFTLKLVVL